MRAPILFLALSLTACSSTPDAPTANEATAALTHALRLSWTATTAPDNAPVRVGNHGQPIALVPSDMPVIPSGKAKPPTVSDVSVSACEVGGDDVVCDTSYRLNGTVQPSQRVRYWRHGAAWRARLQTSR
jgi:hypothetical protein